MTGGIGHELNTDVLFVRLEETIFRSVLKEACVLKIHISGL